MIKPEDKVAVLTFLIDTLEHGMADPECPPNERRAMRWMAAQLETQRTGLLRWPGGRPNYERRRTAWRLVGKAEAFLNGNHLRTLRAAVRDGLLVVEDGIVRPGEQLKNA